MPPSLLVNALLIIIVVIIGITLQSASARIVKRSAKTVKSRGDKLKISGKMNNDNIHQHSSYNSPIGTASQHTTLVSKKVQTADEDRMNEISYDVTDDNDNNDNDGDGNGDDENYDINGDSDDNNDNGDDDENVKFANEIKDVVYEVVEPGDRENYDDINFYGEEAELEDEYQPEIVETEASTDTDIINKLLGKGYDWRVRPPGTNLSIPGGHGPVVVAVNMLIRSISKIDDVNMEYSVQLTFRESWVDGRLAFGYPRDNAPDFVILTAGQQIWMPDSFFQNEKQAQRHMIDKPNVLIRVHKDGTILYSVRISLVLSCPMHLQYYPMDIQTCLIDLASYAYTTDDIEYVWKSKDPVQLKEGLHSSLPSFQLSNVTTTFCTSKTNTGTYSCLRTVLELRRQFSYYLLQLYVPSSMLVIVSWVSFWLDRTAVPARVTLGVTTLLTMTTQASGINAKLPPVSYTKAIDVWIGACLTFIFGALLEFAWVTYISSRSFNKSVKESKMPNALVEQSNQITSQLFLYNKNAIECGEIWVRQKSDPDEESGEQLIVINGGNKRRFGNRQWIKEYYQQCGFIRWVRRKFATTDHAKRADYLSRLIFPAMFLIFNCAYWLRYSQYAVSKPT